MRKYELGSEPGDDLSSVTTPEERLEMLVILTERMWSLTGQSLPSYDRSRMPGRVIRPK